MGSRSSKPLRNAGAAAAERAAPQRAAAQGTSGPAPRAQPGAETSHFSKDQTIVRDAMDPQLVRNLESLGPAHVASMGGARQRGTDPMLTIMRAREQNDPNEAREAPSAVGEGLTVSELLCLLDDYKHTPTAERLEQLAVAYDVDVAVLQRLVKWVSVPQEQPLDAQDAHAMGR
ncbi:hypothetical protein MSPP1_004231 [Malassezia sp. CBS 17886]|nr:hypothetical protein MSPP1_004231 [Malassezia sp. CBS 17886]